MSVYMVVKLFGVIVAVTGPTPYTLEQCRESLSVLTLPQELEATAECVEAAERPQVGELTAEQLRKADSWTELQEAKGRERDGE